MRFTGDDGGARREMRGLAVPDGRRGINEAGGFTGLDERDDDDAPAERRDAARDTPVLGVR